MAILSGFFKTKKYRKTSDGYMLQSEWTDSETVEMSDGSTLKEAASSFDTRIGALETALDGKQIRVLTEARYNALSSAEKNNASIIYFYY